MRQQIANLKCIEVKEHAGNYYLYEYENQWDKERKTVKKTTKYIRTLKQFKSAGVLEHGHVRLLLELSMDFIQSLKDSFPNDWPYLLTFAFNRAINPMPLKRIGSWFEKTTLAKMLPLERVSRKTLANSLQRTGENSAGQRRFLESLINDNELLLYDGSLVYSGSKYNRLVEYGHDKHGLMLPQVNISLLFSKTRALPVFFRLYWGSLHEVKAVKTVVDELEGRNIVFVADKGYYKNSLFEDLARQGIRFIIPLPRDEVRIDYSRKLDGLMQYHGRFIEYARYKKGKYWVYLFRDKLLEFEEKNAFFRLRIERKKNSFVEERAGVIALLSNVKKKPKNVYLMWKSRDEIEKAFHVLQNVLELETPHVSNEDTFKGYVFAAFISLFLHYKVIKLLKEKKVNHEISVADALFELSKVMQDADGTPFEVTKKTHGLLKKLSIENLIVKKWDR